MYLLLRASSQPRKVFVKFCGGRFDDESDGDGDVKRIWSSRMKTRKDAIHWLNDGLKVARKPERASPLSRDELGFWAREDRGNFDVSA